MPRRLFCFLKKTNQETQELVYLILEKI